jgi:type II secretory pathway predicted ATPase ExeA
MTGMDMLTYFLGALVVALLAGLTGRMPMRVMRGADSASTDDADTAGAAAAASGEHDERGLPAEILDAVAAANPKDPSRIVMPGRRRRLVAEIVDSLMEGMQFVVLTGAGGTGKTVMAETIHEELSQRSVRVRWVDGSGGRGIRLRTIMSQFLGKPEADVDTADVERLFDAMTEREGPGERLVLIIDDAEQLLPDALGYLRLLASVAIEHMPQVLFAGDPSFWDIAGRAAQAGFTDLIEARFELGALSPEEAGASATRVVRLEDAATCATPESDIAEPAHRANALVPMVLPPRRNRRIAQMAGLAAVAVGSLGAAAHWAGPPGLDRFWATGRSGVHSSDAAPNPPPAAASVAPLPPVTQAPLAQLDEPAPGRAAKPQLTPLVAQYAAAVPAGQWPAPKAAVHRRTTFSSYVTRSTRGTWLFPLGTNGGG